MKIQITTLFRVVTEHTVDVHQKPENEIRGLIDIQKEQAVDNVCGYVRQLEGHGLKVVDARITGDKASVSIIGFDV